MSTQETSTEDIIKGSSKKDRIIAAHRLSPTIDKKAAADALNVSYEYVRQIFNDIESRTPDEWRKLREGDLDDDSPPELVDAVETRLREAEIMTARTEEPAGSESVSKHGGPEKQKDEPPASASRSIPAEDVQAVRAQMELLLEQAEYTGNSDAEFVARKSIEWLEGLLEMSQRKN